MVVYVSIHTYLIHTYIHMYIDKHTWLYRHNRVHLMCIDVKIQRIFNVLYISVNRVREAHACAEARAAHPVQGL
jgi:hypothetical protein